MLEKKIPKRCTRLSERQVKPKQMNVLLDTQWPHAQLLSPQETNGWSISSKKADTYGSMNELYDCSLI